MAFRFYLAQFIQQIFWFYSLLIFARILLSWFPNWQHYRLARTLCRVTDPYLNLFRRLIPPIGGMLDLSPLVAFFVLQLIKRVLLWLLW
jgi:YggT family protein